MAASKSDLADHPHLVDKADGRKYGNCLYMTIYTQQKVLEVFYRIFVFLQHPLLELGRLEKLHK